MDHKEAGKELDKLLDEMKIGMNPAVRRVTITPEQWDAVVRNNVPKGKDYWDFRPEVKYQLLTGAVKADNPAHVANALSHLAPFPPYKGGKVVFDGEFKPSFVPKCLGGMRADRKLVYEGKGVDHNGISTSIKAGSVYLDPPSRRDVVGSLLNDAQCVRDGQSFEDFCGDMGYDQDSIKANKIFASCIEINQLMIRLRMPDEAFELAGQL